MESDKEAQLGTQSSIDERSAVRGKEDMPLSVGRRTTFLSALTTICLFAVFLMALVTGGAAIVIDLGHHGNRDLVQYWATGRQLVLGANPYDFESISRLERSEGASYTHVALNPPLILGLLAPLGFFTPATAAVLWLIILLASLTISVWILWILNGRKYPLLHLMGFCFAPILTCIMIGQIGIFLLLGVTVFLALHNSRPFLAGAGLLPCVMKPHLFVPLAIVLLLWTIRHRSYRLVIGFLASLGFALAVAYLIDPDAWSQWRHALQLAKPTEIPLSNLSRTFRLIIHQDSGWLQFVPVVGASVWAAWYFWSRQDRWNWLDQGLVLLIVSFGCAPYSWITDESVLLPAVIVGACRAHESGRSLLPFASALGVMLFELMRGLWITTPYFLWTVPAWLGLYFYATWNRKAVRQGLIADART